MMTTHSFASLLDAVRGGMLPREAAPFTGLLPEELAPFLASKREAAPAEDECLHTLLADAIAPASRDKPRRPWAAVRFLIERRFPVSFARLPRPLSNKHPLVAAPPLQNALPAGPAAASARSRRAAEPRKIQPAFSSI